MNNKILTIPTILGILVLIVGVFVGVLIIQQGTVFRLRATPDTTPGNVRVTNTTATSFSVTWTTKEATVGFIKWGDNEGLGKTSGGSVDALTRTHSVDVRNLVPGSEYYFEVNSNGEDHDNAGASWQVTIPSVVLPPRGGELISGTVLNPDLSPVTDALVYVTGGDFAPLSAKVSIDGRWAISLSQARVTTLLEYAQIDKNNTELEIFVQASSAGVAIAKAFAVNVNPAPDIVLGQSYDFRDATAQSSLDTPSLELGLPPRDDSVTLDSVDEGETIFTTTPEFFGDGPSGGTFTITVESEHPVSEEIIVSPDGSWQWSPPSTLANGEHTVTISWLDASGVLQKLTRSFTVFASEDEPAFVSTPSGTTKPIATLKPTLTPLPTLSPTPSPTPTATATPIATLVPSATPKVNLPPAGVGTPTILGLIVGSILIVGSVIIAM